MRACVMTDAGWTGAPRGRGDAPGVEGLQRHLGVCDRWQPPRGHHLESPTLTPASRGAVQPGEWRAEQLLYLWLHCILPVFCSLLMFVSIVLFSSNILFPCVLFMLMFFYCVIFFYLMFFTCVLFLGNVIFLCLVCYNLISLFIKYSFI